MRRSVLWAAAVSAAMGLSGAACGNSGNAHDAEPDATADSTGRDGEGGSRPGEAGSGISDAGATESGDPHLTCSGGGGTFTGGGLGSCVLCTDEAGTFGGAPAGSCNRAPCGGGCTCSSLYGLQCFCPDLEAQTNDGSTQYCIALSCGSIICDTACVCTDPAHGACQCPVDAGPG
jgi:hypothetical protein